MSHGWKLSVQEKIGSSNKQKNDLFAFLIVLRPLMWRLDDKTTFSLNHVRIHQKPKTENIVNTPANNKERQKRTTHVQDCQFIRK